MRDWQIAFTGDWPALAVLAGAAAAAVGAYVCYRVKKAGLPAHVFALLAVLRVLAIVVIAVFLLQPVLRLVRTEAAESPVAVLVDVSESAGIRDTANDRSRLEAAVELLTRPPHRLLDALDNAHELRLFTFGAVTAEVADAGRLAELRPDQKATALGEALKDVQKQATEGGLTAIVVLTDGASNRGDSPEKVALTLGVPVFPVALGGRTGERGRFHDVGIAHVPQAPQYIVNNSATVAFDLTCTGLAKFTDSERELEVKLLEGDEELASETVSFPAEDGGLTRELTFVPDRIGLHRLVLSVEALPDETVTENNTRTFTVRVTDPRIRVLIVEGVIRSEYRFLRRVLESDPNLEVTSVVKLSGKRFLVQGVLPGVDLSRGLPARAEDYAKFDVVVLGDIGSDEFSGLQLEYLKDFVSKGGALLALGGYHAFGAGGYANGPVADVLPVVLHGEADGHTEEAFVPVLTADGSEHLAFSGCAEFFGGAGPGVTLDGANRVGGAKPGAQVLAVHDVERAAGRPMPVVAVQSYGAGRSMAMAADTTWKWKFQVEAKGQDSPYYRFWRQSIRWLAGRKEDQTAPDQSVSGWTPQGEYAPDERVFLKARVRNPDGEPEERAEVDALVDFPIPVKKAGPDGTESLAEGETLRLQPVPLSLGEYQVGWQAPATGLYRAKVTARLEGTELGTDEFEFVVGQAASEFDRIDVDEAALRAVAGETGGAYHTLASAGRIPDELEKRRNLVAHREEINLWNAPWLLTVFLACVTAEWVLRKRRGLN